MVTVPIYDLHMRATFKNGMLDYAKLHWVMVLSKLG